MRNTPTAIKTRAFCFEGHNLKNTLERRLKLLKLEGTGFSQGEIVTALSQEFQVTKRTVRRDFQHRECWQPLIQELNPEKSLLKILNRYEQLYRKASLLSLQADNDSARVGAMHVMLKANAKMCETLLLPEIMHDLDQIKNKLGIT